MTSAPASTSPLGPDIGPSPPANTRRKVPILAIVVAAVAPAAFLPSVVIAWYALGRMWPLRRWGPLEGASYPFAGWVSDARASWLAVLILMALWAGLMSITLARSGRRTASMLAIATACGTVAMYGVLGGLGFAGNVVLAWLLMIIGASVLLVPGDRYQKTVAIVIVGCIAVAIIGGVLDWRRALDTNERSRIETCADIDSGQMSVNPHHTGTVPCP